MTLSVIIITKNEASNIAGCLQSVLFADEMIVVDSGSTDGTVEIATSLGAKVFTTADWPGFGIQKNRALDLATGDWVLSVDADERITPELAQSIQAAMSDPRANAYRIARLSNFGGRWIRHSGWWPDYVLRLFRRGTARFKDAAVHESVLSEGPVATLTGHFLHYPYADLESFISKINHYSSVAAGIMHANGKKTTVLGAVGHGMWTFIRHYVLRCGFLDGKEGLILAIMAGSGSFFRYSKLLFLNQTQTPAEK